MKTKKEFEKFLKARSIYENKLDQQSAKDCIKAHQEYLKSL